VPIFESGVKDWVPINGVWTAALVQQCDLHPLVIVRNTYDPLNCENVPRGEQEPETPGILSHALDIPNRQYLGHLRRISHHADLALYERELTSARLSGSPRDPSAGDGDHKRRGGAISFSVILPPSLRPFTIVASLFKTGDDSLPTDDLNQIEQRFLQAIHHHLDGWRRKIGKDFGKECFDRELAGLAGDPVYHKFAFDCPEYVVVRLMGRMSISVGRRLGEIYDKIPRFVASARFGVAPERVAEKFNGLELDIGLRYNLLSAADRAHVQKVLNDYDAPTDAQGVGIEIRHNFNPNDSARLRKDVDMARYVQEQGLYPVYLIYSAISPRDDAIGRLTRAGWTFLQGEQATSFTNELFGADFLGIMERPEVRDRIHEEVRQMMHGIFESHAFKQVAANQPAVKVT
jgi:hypothetical protein